MKRAFVLLFVACAAAASAPAADDDVQDVVFLGEGRPVLIRLHLRVDGQPFGSAWGRYVGELFAYLDRDGDGVLSRPEAVRAPSGQQFQMMRQMGYTYGVGGAATFATFAELDADEDEEVLYEEFVAYYRRTGAAGVQMTVLPPRATTADTLTDTLFRLLDKGKGGGLSAENVSAAEKLLRPFDLDDSELVSTAELLPTPNATAGAGGGAMMMTQARARADQGAFFLVTPDDSPNRLTQRLALAQRLSDRYDKDKNGSLTPGEIGLDREAFQALDSSKDGELDAVELMRLLRRPPDVEAVIRLGKTSADEQPADLVARDGKAAPLAGSVRKGTSGTLLLSVGDAQVDIRRAAGDGGEEPEVVAQANRIREAYLGQIKTADTKGKGYVEKADLQRPQFRQFHTLFDLADRDGDGRLTEEEAKGWFDVQAKSIGSYVAMAVADGGRGLFDIVDANRDNSLGPRELRTAWARLAPYDRDGDGKVSRHEIPRQYQMTIGLGQASVAPRPQAGAGGTATPEAVAVTTRGPLWFRKMDRNGDGDVSPREFLGPREEFDKMDTDGDGLVSVEEAERGDAARRKTARRP